MPVALTGVNELYCRIYSGNSPTPYYVNLFQIDQPEIPMMEPRAETAIQTDGGRMTNYAATYITDETTPFMPIDFTLRVASTADYREILRAFGNFQRWPEWNIGGHTWQPVPISALGTRKDSRGNDINCVPPKDAVQLQHLVNFAWTELNPPDALGGTEIYGELKGMVVSNVTRFTEGQLNFFNITGMIYGSVNPRLSAWPDGVESFPS